MSKIYQEIEPTERQIEAMKKADEIMKEVDLEIIGTRPKDRE